MDLDTILPDVGEFGLYQQLLLWFVLLPGVLPCGFHAYNQLFMAARPDHWCRVPELDVLVDVSIEFIKNISIPLEQRGGEWRFSKCLMYDRNYSALLEQFETEPVVLPVNRTTRCIHGWHYDYSEYATTVVTEWDLVCDKEIYTTLALVLLAIGGLVGNYVFGYLQDSIGRRPVFFIYLFIEFFFGIATAFAQDFWTWCALRFGVGFTVPAVLGTPYVLAIELVGPARRTTCTLLTNVAYSIGLIILSAVVYFVRDWRQLALATSIPFLSFFLYWWVLPESPRWLLAQGRFEEAEKILKKMARVNGKALPANYMVHLRRKYHVERYIQKKARKHQYGVLDLVRTPNLRRKTLMVTFIWFTNTCVYVGLTYYAPVLGGDEFLNFFLAGAVELPVYVFLWPSMDCWGRRWILCFSMVTGGAACLGTFFFENESKVKLGLFCVGKMGICSSFVVLPLMASELYPTVVRGLGMSTSSIIGMLGPVFVPFVVHMGEDRSSVTLTAMGSLMVMSGVLSLLLPETLHQHLPQTLEDGETFGKTWSWRQWITCCPPRDGMKKEDKSTSKESPIRSLIQHHIRDPKPVTVVEGTTPDFMTASTATTEDTISEATTPEHTLKITVV